MKNQQIAVCVYYRAIITREKCWFLTATLRSFEHVCFDRTYDKALSQFEFFVPPEMEPVFLIIMSSYKEQGLVNNLEKLPNRLEDPAATL